MTCSAVGSAGIASLVTDWMPAPSGAMLGRGEDNNSWPAAGRNCRPCKDCYHSNLLGSEAASACNGHCGCSHHSCMLQAWQRAVACDPGTMYTRARTYLMGSFLGRNERVGARFGINFAQGRCNACWTGMAAWHGPIQGHIKALSQHIFWHKLRFALASRL